MLMFAGFLMTFFWSDAILRGYLSQKELQDNPDKITSFFTIYFLGSLVAMIILIAGQSWLIPLFTNRAFLPGLELFALYQVLLIPLLVAPFTGLLKGQDILLASFYVLIAPAFSCWTGFTSMPGMNGILLGLFCYALVGFIWVLTKTNFRAKFYLREVIIAVWPATWPLMLYAISAGLARSFDAWLVARYFDESMFAIFRYGAREFPLVVALSAGLGIVMISRLTDNSAISELRLRSTRLMHSCYPIIAVLLLTSPSLFELIFGPSYKPAAAIFNIYLLLTLTQFFFPQTIITARGDTKLLWYISLMELIINVVASVILLQWLGIVGIAWGTLIAFAFEKIMLIWLVNKQYAIRPFTYVNLRVWLFYTTILILCYIVSQWVYGV